MPHRLVFFNLEMPRVNRAREFALALCLFLGSGSVSAHLINPFKNKYSQDVKTILGFASEDVHEEITQLARSCQVQHRNAPIKPLVCSDELIRSVEINGNKYDSLIRGVWWNDDPNQQLYAAGQGKFFGWMKEADKIAKRGKNFWGRSAAIDSSYKMTYRSHYGDLQFIHGMASRDGECPRQTRDSILAWAQFTYEVATGRQDLETTMNQVSPVELRPFFANQSGWTINYLFAPKYRLKGADHNRRMAAGSLLHMVQDSYSESHTSRTFEPTENCPVGSVVEFHSYVSQDAVDHKQRDLRKAWMLRTFTDSQNPLHVSATLLHFIEHKTDWSIVSEYLNEVVFCLDTNAVPASPGPVKAVRTNGR